MNKKKFIYLVQGSKKNVLKYSHLQSDTSDLITLTYDNDIVQSEVSWITNIFFPNSTFAEGRNKQLEIAKTIANDYLYYIFLDDDVSIKKGSYKEFENLLIEHEPAVGVPLCDIVKNTSFYILNLEIQHPVILDQLVQAYHRKVVDEKIVLPFITEFDSLSWWYSCEINNFLILRYYRGYVMQFNTIEANNDNHNWDSDTKQSTVINSNYVGGTNDIDLIYIKEYVENNFGPQPHLVNTLFHPSGMPRLVYLPDLRDSIHRILNFLFSFKIGSLLSIGTKILRYTPLSIYQSIFNKKNIIDQRFFQSYRSKSVSNKL